MRREGWKGERSKSANKKEYESDLKTSTKKQVFQSQRNINKEASVWNRITYA